MVIIITCLPKLFDTSLDAIQAPIDICQMRLRDSNAEQVKCS